ncbi:MAG: phosphatase family protein [Candidatus Saccharibacteria bacterium]|nr:phosphatase family protein [Candidatus Saccharibacteria bacterium]
MDNLIIFAAKYLIILPVLVVLYLALTLSKPKRLELLYLLVVGGLLSFLLAKIGSHIYSDPRPFLADHVKSLVSAAHDNGFPSDHTLLSAFLAYVVWAFWKKAGIALLVVALIVGTGRVAAGVHHAPDIAGGIFVAGLGFAISYKLLVLYRKQHVQK